MKKIYYLLGCVALSSVANAQLFTDDFESYNTGALGPQSTSWTTWSGTEGGAEDGIVSTAQASSGTKSIYFNSTAAGGGPQDCVLDFGPVYNSGVFTYQSDFFVNATKSAYFNFQASQTIGQTWALNVNMSGNSISIDDGITPDLAIGSYTSGTWFTLKIEANLTLGLWKAYVDGTLIGVWENGINSLASIDLFPLQGSQFYVDDVSFDQTPYTISATNAAISGLNMDGNIATQVVNPVITVMNAGTTTLNSFDVTLNYNGSNITQNITGINLASLASYPVTFNGVVLAAGNLPVTATVSNVNGASSDDIAADNSATISINPVVPALGKMVVGEEGTGTWCQWCPRGAVYMDLFEQEYDQFWAGIAVHNADPMTVTDYDAAIGGLIGGYPSALVDRGSEVDPSGMGNQFFQRLQSAPRALIQNGATWDPATRMLYVSVTANFQNAADNNYKLACVLTEDDVTGTGAGWSQSNAYAGGGNGAMGGFESLPNPVPAAQMVYNHVARAILPSFNGFANSFPATVNSGESHTVNFLFILPAGWDENNIHIIGMLIDPNGGIDNAGKATIPEAVDNGYVYGTVANVAEMDLSQPDAIFAIAPNPATNSTVLSINLNQEAEIGLSIIDMSGKVLAERNYGNLNGSSTISLNTSTLNPGVYLVNLTVNGESLVKRLVIE
jgi:hypothetical protein